MLVRPPERRNLVPQTDSLPRSAPDTPGYASLIDPHAPLPISPWSLVASLWRNRALIIQITKRDVIGRYRGSVVGLAWAFLNPLFMLVVYTFVFSGVFNARWSSNSNENTMQFAIILFSGLIVNGIFSDVLNRSPTLIGSHGNYVRKIVFPLEVLPVIAMGTALTFNSINLGVLLTTFLCLNGYLHWTVIFAPLVVLPLIVLALGLAWLLASLGAFLRDISQFVGVITTALMFLSPVFYPIQIGARTLTNLATCEPPNVHH